MNTNLFVISLRSSNFPNATRVQLSTTTQLRDKTFVAHFFFSMLHHHIRQNCCIILTSFHVRSHLAIIEPSCYSFPREIGENWQSIVSIFRCFGTNYGRAIEIALRLKSSIEFSTQIVRFVFDIGVFFYFVAHNITNSWIYVPDYPYRVARVSCLKLSQYFQQILSRCSTIDTV